MFRSKAKLKKKIKQLENSLKTANESRELLSDARVEFIRQGIEKDHSIKLLKESLKFTSKAVSNSNHYLDLLPRENLGVEMAFNELKK